MLGKQTTPDYWDGGVEAVRALTRTYDLDSRVHGEAGVVGGLDSVRLLVKLEHLVGVPAV